MILHFFFLHKISIFHCFSILGTLYIQFSSHQGRVVLKLHALDVLAHMMILGMHYLATLISCAQTCLYFSFKNCKRLHFVAENVWLQQRAQLHGSEGLISSAGLNLPAGTGLNHFNQIFKNP